MGIIVDSTVWVGNERRGRTVGEALQHLRALPGSQDLAISVITAAELVHGVRRAKPADVKAKRQEFVEAILDGIPVLPITLQVARVAGEIDGETRERGVVIPTADLFIGATALQLGFQIATANVRHFRLIPGLVVRLVE